MVLDQQPPNLSASYDTDAFAWAERQAGLLRQLAEGAVTNLAIDWTNVIEEIRDVGLSELRACSSLLTQAMVHLLKLHAWPRSQAVGLWRDEIRRFLDDAADRFTPSMQQRIVLDVLYARALRRVRDVSDTSGLPATLPNACPFTLECLLTEDVAVLLSHLA